MESRLTQCLNEIIYADDCPADLRSVLANVVELEDVVSAFDVNDFEEFIASNDFTTTVYELFGVEL